MSDSIPQIWYVLAPKDGYFVGVLIADSEAQARSLAWEEFTRGRPDVIDGEPEWAAYHRSPDELVVFPLGTSYFGTDGEGNLEVDVPWDVEIDLRSSAIKRGEDPDAVLPPTRKSR